MALICQEFWISQSLTNPPKDSTCLQKQHRELLRLRLSETNLPAKLSEIFGAIEASATMIESLVKECGCDREQFMAAMLKAAKGTGHFPADQRTLTLRAQGFLTL